MRAKRQRDAEVRHLLSAVDRRRGVCQRDASAAGDEQRGGGQAAAAAANHRDSSILDAECHRYLNFSVVRLKSAKMIARIRKRVMIFGSCQPMSSKW